MTPNTLPIKRDKGGTGLPKMCTQHIVKLWNSLPQDVVIATKLDGFKRGLDKFLEDEAIDGY